MQEYIIDNPAITFSKDSYRRYTDHLTYKKKYITSSNIFTFEFGNENDIEIIKNIWISNYNSIDKINFLAVPKYHSPQQVLSCEFNELLPNENIINFNHNNITLQTLLEIPNTILINSISIDTLIFLNNKNKSYFLEILISKNSNVLQLIDRCNYKLVLFFEKNKVEEVNITVKYSKVLSEDEITKFKKVEHEYLIKRYIEVSYNVKPLEEINLNFIYTSQYTIMVKSPKKLNSVKIAGYDLIDTRENPENIYISENYHYYVLDQLDEKGGFSNDIQPYSHYSFKNTDKIIINHDYNEEIPIVVTYFLYDVQRIIKKDFCYLSYQYEYRIQLRKHIEEFVNKNLETNNLLSEEEFNQKMKEVKFNLIHFNMDITDYNKKVIKYSDYKLLYKNKYQPVIEQHTEENNILVVNDITINNNISVPFNNINIPVVPFNDVQPKLINLYFSIFKDLIYEAEKKSAVKKILPNETICEITMEELKKDDYYYICSTCNGNFEMSAFKEWIEKFTRDDTCPKCRTHIKSIPKLYKNSRFF